MEQQIQTTNRELGHGDQTAINYGVRVQEDLSGQEGARPSDAIRLVGSISCEVMGGDWATGGVRGSHA
jgi:hypothetical protein